MYTEAWKMSELSWFRKAIVSGVAALLLASTIQTPAEADPAFFGHPRAGSQHDPVVAGNGLTAERRDEAIGRLDAGRRRFHHHRMRRLALFRYRGARQFADAFGNAATHATRADQMLAR